MRFLLTLIFLYLILGGVVVALQVENTPCQRPLVLDERHRDVTTGIGGTLLGNDNDVRFYLLQDVLLWAPRLVEHVVQGGMSVDDFIMASVCRDRF